MKVKDMRRSSWQTLKEKEQIILPCSYGNAQGKVSLMKIKKISVPFSAMFHGRKYILAERDYTWVQLAMENDFAWFTAMFDEKGTFLQIYIDLTCGNQTQRENPVFEDLYIDYVVCDHQMMELDRDELLSAYDNSLISEELYKRALEQSRILSEALRKNTDEITAYFEDLLHMLEDAERNILPKLRLKELTFL